MTYWYKYRNVSLGKKHRVAYRDWREWPWTTHFKAWVFALLRPFVVETPHPNEDYLCGACGDPVLKRVLTCSEECWAEIERRHGSFAVAKTVEEKQSEKHS